MNYIYLFFISFLSATLLPLGSEGVLLYQLSNGLNLYILFLSATFGNSLGSIVNYYLGLKGESFLVRKKIVDTKSITNGKKYFNRYGKYSLLLAWVPIIGDPITFIAGILKYDFKKFILLILISKGGRYLFVIGGYWYYTNSQ